MSVAVMRPALFSTRAVRCRSVLPHAIWFRSHPLSSVIRPPRVLIFLEALALGKEPPAFGLHLCPQLLTAAQRLGLRPLEVRSASELRWREAAGLNGVGGQRVASTAGDDTTGKSSPCMLAAASGGCWALAFGACYSAPTAAALATPAGVLPGAAGGEPVAAALLLV